MSKDVKNTEVKSFLGKGTEFNGILNFEGAVRVDGKLDGEVISKDMLVVGECAEIKADIDIGTIVIMGKVSGNIEATEKVEIIKGGEFMGNIKTPSLFVEVGAIFDGNCEMIKKDKKISLLPKAQKNSEKEKSPPAA
jgi:cytoskeletal protein CcmA (bactofilin family)